MKSHQPASAALEDSATAVRLQVTIYELHVASANIERLDAAKLADADFSKSLPELGDAKPLYRVDQRASLSGDHIMLGREEPIVTSTRVTDRGQRMNTVQYSNVGAIIDFKADRLSPKRLNVNSSIEMSTRGDSPVKVAESVASPMLRKVTMSLKGPVNLNEPSVLISADATSLDENQKATVHVARLIVSAAGQ